VQTAIAMGFLPRPAIPPFAKPGDHGSHVLLVQRVLHVRPASGFYGAVTTRAVAAWQRRHHLHPTGVVDRLTFHELHL
jgi:peptidoglycan hydrolase-like protein with peptidoglycan-binding domain